MEKNMKKDVSLSHFTVEQELTQHCKSAILPFLKKFKKE